MTWSRYWTLLFSTEHCPCYALFFYLYANLWLDLADNQPFEIHLMATRCSILVIPPVNKSVGSSIYCKYWNFSVWTRSWSYWMITVIVALTIWRLNRSWKEILLPNITLFCVKYFFHRASENFCVSNIKIYIKVIPVRPS